METRCYPKPPAGFRRRYSGRAHGPHPNTPDPTQAAMSTPSTPRSDARPGPGAASAAPLAAAFRAPWLGPLAFVTVLLWKPVAHTLAVLLHRQVPGNAGYAAGFAIGLTGAILVWRGLRRDEHTATCLGLAGGLLIWIGWMEYAFVFFAESMRIPWVTLPDGTPALPPQFVLMQGTTVPVLLVLYLMLVANRDTGCRRRAVAAPPPAPEPRRPDPRHKPPPERRAHHRPLGDLRQLVHVPRARHAQRPAPLRPRAPDPVRRLRAVRRLAGYCIVARMPRIESLPLALRYGVGVVGPAWAAIEIGSYKDFWTEVWIKPAQYPATVTAITLAFAALAALVYRQPASSQPARPSTPANA